MKTRVAIKLKTFKDFWISYRNLDLTTCRRPWDKLIRASLNSIARNDVMLNERMLPLWRFLPFLQVNNFFVQAFNTIVIMTDEDVYMLPIILSLIVFFVLLLTLFIKCTKCPYDFRARCDDGFYDGCDFHDDKFTTDRNMIGCRV